MNWYYAIAGIFVVITGFVHMILGEKLILSRLKQENLSTHYSGDVTKTTLRWFWHVGSFIVFFVGALALLIGFSDGIIPNEKMVGTLLLIIYMGINGLLILLNITKPKKLMEYPQIIIMLIIMVLFYLGRN